MFMYTSLFYIKWEEIRKGPGILVAAFIHERKTKNARKFFFDGFNDLFCSDGKAAITSQIDEYWPQVDRYRCWRHSLEHVEMELRRNKRKQEIGAKLAYPYLALFMVRSTTNFDF